MFFYAFICADVNCENAFSTLENSMFQSIPFFVLFSCYILLITYYLFIIICAVARCCKLYSQRIDLPSRHQMRKHTSQLQRRGQTWWESFAPLKMSKKLISVCVCVCECKQLKMKREKNNLINNRRRKILTLYVSNGHRCVCESISRKINPDCAWSLLRGVDTFSWESQKGVKWFMCACVCDFIMCIVACCDMCACACLFLFVCLNKSAHNPPPPVMYTFLSGGFVLGCLRDWFVRAHVLY